MTLAGPRTRSASASRRSLGGQLTGTGNGNRQVVLQSNPFPYLQGFQNAAQRAGHRRGGQLLVPDRVGDDQHAVPRADAAEARGREPDRAARRRRAREHPRQRQARPPRPAGALLRAPAPGGGRHQGGDPALPRRRVADGQRHRRQAQQGRQVLALQQADPDPPRRAATACSRAPRASTPPASARRCASRSAASDSRGAPGRAGAPPNRGRCGALAASSSSSSACVCSRSRSDCVVGSSRNACRAVVTVAAQRRLDHLPLERVVAAQVRRERARAAGRRRSAARRRRRCSAVTSTIASAGRFGIAPSLGALTT